MATDVPSEADRTLDARSVDGPPFDAISEALAALGGDECLRLVNSFEPAPLYEVLAARGFTHETEQVGPDEWHVLIEHE